MKSSKKKEYKVGDIVSAILLTSSGKKKTVRGQVKKVTKYWGLTTYIVTKGIVDDFSVRKVK